MDNIHLNLTISLSPAILGICHTLVMASANESEEKTLCRYGIGELYGNAFASLTPERIGSLVTAKFKTQPCPFQPSRPPCNKKGGVCSLQNYTSFCDSVQVTPNSPLVTTCPRRFLEAGIVYSWVGKEMLGCQEPLVAKEVPFLVSPRADDSDVKEDAVGRIDMVLVNPELDRLKWCALEMQAVYFSGPKMSDEFDYLKNWTEPGIPWPQKIRRPDFRSSGPKRLMPQLQIKVPTISRWGKKTAVVVDLPFWNAMGKMTEVGRLSNCDIAWFVVDYEKNGDSERYQLKQHSIHLTTLDRAVEGLTGGTPTSLEDFESKLREKLNNQ